MSERSISFFDNESDTPSFSLWSKERGEMQKIAEKAIFKGNLYKYSKKSQKYKERFFALANGKLYCARSAESARYIGYLGIQFSTFTVERETLGGETVYILRFIRDFKCAKLLLKDKEILERFSIAAKPYVVQTNFHDVYEAKKIIGQGAFASVYLCVHRKTGERVAVKCLSKKKSMKMKDGKLLIMNEMEISSSLDNTHLLKLIEVFESPSSVYLVFELLEGGDLVSYLRTQEYISHQDIYTIVRTILKGLLFLQMNGILHRDIKPDNILLKRKGEMDFTQIKIVDFGLATRSQVESYIVNRCGTPGYMAPEIIKYDPDISPKLTFKCDVFSVGVILYFIIAGRRPFVSDSTEEILKLNERCKISFDDPRFDQMPYLKELLQLMLEPNPVLRICARDALNHRFFDECDSPADDLRFYDSELFPCENNSIVCESTKFKDVKFIATEGLMNGMYSGSGATSTGSVKLH